MNDVYLKPPSETDKKYTISTSPSYYNNKGSSFDVSSNPYLSTYSLTSSEYMSIFNKDNLPNENFEFYPRVLHIPNSITCQNDFSWGLWNWIHSLDDVNQDNVFHDRYPSEEETIPFTKIYNQEGGTFTLRSAYDHHPKHFHLERNSIPTPKSEALTNQNNNSLNNYVNARSNENHPVYKGISPSIIPRLYLHVLSFKGEHFKNVSSICLSIDIDNKKIFTGIVPCFKNDDGTVTAQFNEAYVFDAPSMDFKVTVSVYGLYHKTINKSFIHNIKHTLNIKSDHKKGIKPSYTGVFRNYHLNNEDLCQFAKSNVTGPKNSTLNKSFSIISNTFTLKKNHNKKEATPKNPMDSIDVDGKEIFIGDYELHFKVEKTDKTTNTYKLNPVVIPNPKPNGAPITNDKYHQYVVLQSGIYFDEKVKETIAYINENVHCDYLSVQLSTTQVPIWKRYWVIFKENMLTFYDFEYKEKKEPIGKIDIHTIKSLGLPNPEYNSMPNCFCIEFQDGKDLADIVGVYQKEGDYNEKNVESESTPKKYARIKPKDNLLLRKEKAAEVGESHSNINSNNTLYSSKKEELNNSKEDEGDEGKEEIPSITIDGKDSSTTIDQDQTKKEGEVDNSLDNVALNMDAIENLINDISIDEKPEVNTSNNTLHQQDQEKIPHYEWINRVVTKSTAYFYTDSPSKLTQWMKIIEESPCFRIDK